MPHTILGRPWLLRTMVGALLGAILIVSGCADAEEAEVAPPEIAEVEAEADEPGGVEFEQAYPIEAEDVGDMMMVSGTVVGQPGPNGFFVQAEGNRVIFVESAQPATLGQRVRAMGPLQAAEVTVFEGWERDFLGDADPEWETIRLYYVAATSVTPI